MTNRTHVTLAVSALFGVLLGCSHNQATKPDYLVIQFVGAAEVDFGNGNIGKLWKFTARNPTSAQRNIPIDASYEVQNGECGHLLHPDAYFVDSMDRDGNWLPRDIVLETRSAPSHSVVLRPGEYRYLLVFERQFADPESMQDAEHRLVVRDSLGADYFSPLFRFARVPQVDRMSNPCASTDMLVPYEGTQRLPAARPGPGSAEPDSSEMPMPSRIGDRVIGQLSPVPLG